MVTRYGLIFLFIINILFIIITIIIDLNNIISLIIKRRSNLFITRNRIHWLQYYLLGLNTNVNPLQIIHFFIIIFINNLLNGYFGIATFMNITLYLLIYLFVAILTSSSLLIDRVNIFLNLVSRLICLYLFYLLIISYNYILLFINLNSCIGTLLFRNNSFLFISLGSHLRIILVILHYSITFFICLYNLLL